MTLSKCNIFSDALKHLSLKKHFIVEKYMTELFPEFCLKLVSCLLILVEWQMMLELDLIGTH